MKNELMERVQRIENAVAIIEESAPIFLSESADQISAQMKIISELLREIFPMIIQNYSEEMFCGRQEEISVWVQLLQQITQTLTGNDTFAKTDILYEVLRPDLKEHIQIIRGAIANEE